jgi:hypothetical protein
MTGITRMARRLYLIFRLAHHDFSIFIARDGPLDMEQIPYPVEAIIFFSARRYTSFVGPIFRCANSLCHSICSLRAKA